MGVRRGLLLAVAALAVPGMVVVGAAAPAAAQDEADVGPPLRGWFVRDSLIYPNTPDGWACHFLGQCRPPGARTDDGPGPIAVVGYGQNVELICQFGSYAKITTTAAGDPAPTTTPPPPPAAKTQPPPPSPSIRTPRPTPPATAAPAPAPAPAGPAPATTSPRPTGSHTPASSPAAIPDRSPGASTPTSSRSAQAAPLTVTGGPAEITEPVSGWAPVADIATAPELRAARCTVDQWAW